MDLYAERGFDRTTVAEIAARAGLTERTFFRYFADKREVLFWGAGALQNLVVEGIAQASPETTPLDAVTGALEATASVFAERRQFARQRQTLIAAHAELQEREVMKLTSLASAIAEALRARGVGEHAASLTAQVGVAVFRVAFERWIDDARRRDLREDIRATLAELKAVTAGAVTGSSTPRARKASRPK